MASFSPDDLVLDLMVESSQCHIIIGGKTGRCMLGTSHWITDRLITIPVCVCVCVNVHKGEYLNGIE